MLVYACSWNNSHAHTKLAPKLSGRVTTVRYTILMYSVPVSPAERAKVTLKVRACNIKIHPISPNINETKYCKKYHSDALGLQLELSLRYMSKETAVKKRRR